MDYSKGCRPLVTARMWWVSLAQVGEVIVVQALVRFQHWRMHLWAALAQMMQQLQQTGLIGVP